jgi:hypothetical protein
MDSIPVWGLLPITVFALCAAMEIGYRIGQWRHLREPLEKEQPVGAMVAAVLGLLAFILGFTFSLAASRFEARRQIVLQEANAVGTTYLRASFLPGPQADEVRRLLRSYVDVRLRGVMENEVESAVASSELLHESLWAQAVTAAQQSPESISTGLFVQSLNQLIDLHAERLLVGLRSRIPPVIWIGLVGLAVLGIGSVGYQAGLSATRRSPAMLSLIIAFCLVLTLIADLDRAHEGLLRVSQQALVDVQQSMSKPSGS